MGGKTLFYCNTSSFFINHHLSWARAVEAGEKHLAVTIDRDGDAAYLSSCGFVVHPLHERRGSVNPMTVAGEILVVRRLVARVRPTLLVSITIKCLFAAAAANLGPGSIPVVGFVTGLGYLFAGNGWKQRLLRGAVMPTLAASLRTMRHSVVFSNADDQDEFLRRGVVKPAHAAIIPVPGIDTGRFHPSPEPAGGFRVVLPARMLYEKGVEEFVQAAERAKKRLPGCEFLLAGTTDPGNPSAIPVERLRHWDAAGTVRWLGHVTDMPALYASCHVVCLPSYREGFPRSLVEAMACGRAVVTSDVPGCRDVAGSSGDRGLLLPELDCVSLVEALCFLHDHPDERRAMALRGRRWVESSQTEGMIAARVGTVLAAMADGCSCRKKGEG